jgi:hypothetical protein
MDCLQTKHVLPKLPVGRYDLTFQIEGFKPLKRPNVVVDTDAALQINAALEVGAQSLPLEPSSIVVSFRHTSRYFSTVEPRRTLSHTGALSQH